MKKNYFFVSFLVILLSVSNYSVGKPGGNKPGNTTGGTLGDLGCAADGSIAKFLVSTEFPDGHWVCSTDEIGIGDSPRWVVRDAVDSIIGKVIRIDLPFTPVVTAVIPIPLESNLDTIRNVIVEIQDGAINNNGLVLFTNNDCTGDPYLLASEQLPPAFDAISVVQDGANQAIYVTSDSTESTQINAGINSMLSSEELLPGFGQCFVVTADTSLVVLAEEIITSFSYSWPLRIESAP